MSNYVIKNIEFDDIGEAFKLVKNVFMEFDADKIKLNSSSYARSFYKKIGFVDTDIEQVKNGIRYTPMELNVGD